MNSNSTSNLAKLEEFSLVLIDFFDKLPDNFFQEEHMQPSDKVVKNIIKYSKEKQALGNDSRVYRYMPN